MGLQVPWNNTPKEKAQAITLSLTQLLESGEIDRRRGLAHSKARRMKVSKYIGLKSPIDISDFNPIEEFFLNTYTKGSTVAKAAKPEVTKAEAIRQTWSKMGLDSKAVDVIKAVEKQGYKKVSSAEVSTSRKKLLEAAKGVISPSVRKRLEAGGNGKPESSTNEFLRAVSSDSAPVDKTPALNASSVVQLITQLVKGGKTDAAERIVEALM